MIEKWKQRLRITYIKYLIIIGIIELLFWVAVPSVLLSSIPGWAFISLTILFILGPVSPALLMGLNPFRKDFNIARMKYNNDD